MNVKYSCKIFNQLGHCHSKSLLSPYLLTNKRNIRFLFHENHIKSGYESKKEPSQIDLIKDGFKQLKNELKLFKKEIIEKFECDPIIYYPPGVIDKIWEFRTKESLDQWTVTCDSDHGEGHSKCEFSINNFGNGLFSGILNTEVPKDGIIKRAGYCSIRTKRARKSFKRDSYLNWEPYTHLVIKCRGDGRNYLLNLATCGYFDQFWNDMYHYVLHTRGGPYWQLTKIPFSKFFFGSKGRIQDLQHAMSRDKITNFGITAADKINGSFSLEINYIGLEFDPYHKETYAYELYRLPKNLAAN